MPRPPISCIVPVFNGARYIASALESILRQTYAPAEIIVVDDGSTDATADVLARYSNRVRSLRQQNAGPAAARNTGLNSARGEFVAFLDADDLWHPEKLSRQMSRFVACPELDLCIAHVQNFWVPELAEEEARLRNHRFSQPVPGYATQALLARRALFDRVGRFATTLRAFDDAEWFLRAIDKKAVLEILPDVLVYRRLHQNNLSRSAIAQDAMFQVVKANLDRRRRTAGT